MKPTIPELGAAALRNRPLPSTLSPTPLLRGLRRVVLLAGLCAATAWAQSTVFVSRHEDRGPEEPDALLTPTGLCQAEALGYLLSKANIKHIYTTELTRTKQTAAPTARISGVTPVIVAQKDLPGLIAKVKETLKDGESTLVVGHRSTVPKIVKALSGEAVEPLGSGEYTRLFAVTIFPDGRASVVTLRQGCKCGEEVKN